MQEIINKTKVGEFWEEDQAPRRLTSQDQESNHRKREQKKVVGKVLLTSQARHVTATHEIDRQPQVHKSARKRIEEQAQTDHKTSKGERERYGRERKKDGRE